MMAQKQGASPSINSNGNICFKYDQKEITFKPLSTSQNTKFKVALLPDENPSQIVLVRSTFDGQTHQPSQLEIYILSLNDKEIKLVRELKVDNFVNRPHTTLKGFLGAKGEYKDNDLLVINRNSDPKDRIVGFRFGQDTIWLEKGNQRFFYTDTPNNEIPSSMLGGI